MPTKNSHRKRLFLIDGYAMLYRSHFAMIRQPLVTSKGLHTSALFGFTNQVFRLLREEQPDYLASIFDTAEKTFRHEQYPEYKATREKMPEELQDQLPYLWKLLEAMRIPNLSKEGFEADDIIGTLAKWGAAKDLEVYIVSGDKDFMQLVNDHVYLYAPGGRNMQIKVYDREGVIEKWGVPPEKIIDLLGLMGDSSDNVPGVRGVGEKSAVKLIKEFGSLEASLENVENVTNKRVKNGLLECREEALLSKKLVTIHTAVQLDYDLESMQLDGFDIDQVTPLFQDLEFTGLYKQLEEFIDEPIETEPDVEKHYTTLKTRDDLDSFVKSIRKGTMLSFDLETTSVDPMQADIVGFSFSTEADSGVYIPIRFPEKTGELFGGDNDLNTVIDVLKPVLENRDIPKTGQNIKYDALIVKRHGVHVKPLAFDTMIAAHLINPDLRSYKLDKLAQEQLGYTMVPIEELIGRGRNQITMDQVALDKVAFYAAEDADIAWQLTPIYQEQLSEEDLTDFFEKVERPLIDVLIDMEYTGTFVERSFLEDMSAEMGKQIEALVADIHREAGTEFNVNSTQQLAQVLFDKIGLKPVRKRSTAESVLERLRNDHPLPGLILDYRRLNKLKNTYLDTLPDFINPETGRIHTTFSQTIAATGRLSSSNPNFQNIPIRHEEGREIRKAFRAQKKGWKILSADYSQIELRIMAHLSQDPALMKAFQNNEDIHTRTASLVYNVPLENVLPEMRRTAKVVNFGIMYGAGPYRMSQELGIPWKEGQAIIDTYFKQYSGIYNYIEATLEQARTEHFVSTMLGRRRPVWDADSDNRMRREAAERMAINMPIQGTAAEMIKLAMIHLHERLKSTELRTSMILQIHDELIFEVHEEDVDPLSKIVVEEMESALELSVPVVVDWGVADSWYDAH